MPRSKGYPTPADESRIRAALECQDELRAAVVAAAGRGASVRVLAELTGLSTNTISRWKRGVAHG